MPIGVNGGLTSEQREAITRSIIYPSYIRLRSPSVGRNPKGAEALRDALDRSVAMAEGLHNLPLFLYREEFDFDLQIRNMTGSSQRAPELRTWTENLRRIREGDYSDLQF